MKVETRSDSLFGWSCSVRVDGRPGGRLELPTFGRSGSIVLDGEEYAVTYRGLGSGAWDLVHKNRVVASAIKTMMRSHFTIDCDGESFELEKTTFMGRGYHLRKGGRAIGTMERAGWFSRNMVGELSENCQPAGRAFVMWLVVMMWRRRARRNS